MTTEFSIFNRDQIDELFDLHESSMNEDTNVLMHQEERFDDFKVQSFQNCNIGVTNESSELKCNFSPLSRNFPFYSVQEKENSVTGKQQEIPKEADEQEDDSFLVLALSPSKRQLSGSSLEHPVEFSFSLSKSANFPKMVSVSSSSQQEAVNSKKNYENIVDNLVTSCKQKCKVRRDVINKRIIRYFRKYIRELSPEHKMLCRITKPISQLKSEMIDRAIHLGILNEDSDESFKEYLCWMCTYKKTDKVNKIFDLSNPSIKLSSDLFLKYTHLKLDLALENKNIASMFMFFIRNKREEFLSQFSEDLRKVYSDGLNSLITKATLNLNIC
ncbi:unnamed protein product [Moneuplotes crassus]|uniref:Uncharacterized protein n=1 Tax=Euplotes crassus TaxID=5936 RepID=A0AAD1XS15_EUPCR|nr:unnamed protein product [Moneuplotes crassus]